jgi:hypothetical protein
MLKIIESWKLYEINSGGNGTPLLVRPGVSVESFSKEDDAYEWLGENAEAYKGKEIEVRSSVTVTEVLEETKEEATA